MGDKSKSEIMKKYFEENKIYFREIKTSGVRTNEILGYIDFETNSESTLFQAKKEKNKAELKRKILNLK